jgi:hypothetical protein
MVSSLQVFHSKFSTHFCLSCEAHKGWALPPDTFPCLWCGGLLLGSYVTLRNCWHTHIAAVTHKSCCVLALLKPPKHHECPVSIYVLLCCQRSSFTQLSLIKPDCNAKNGSEVLIFITAVVTYHGTKVRLGLDAGNRYILQSTVLEFPLRDLGKSQNPPNVRTCALHWAACRLR